MIVRTHTTQLVVRRLPRLGSSNNSQCRAILLFPGRALPCAIGRGGMKARKREGDGATPVGVFPLRQIFFRRDRSQRSGGGLPQRAIRCNDGWCDRPADRNYNRFVQHPYPASAERLWRDDGLYDLVLVVGYNDRPRVKGLGSAIFLHVANRNGRGPLEATEGCIALEKRHVAHILARTGRRTRLIVEL